MEIAKADMIVLFGATGDLAQRMLLPSLYFLEADGFLPDGFRIVATARTAMSREAFLDHAARTVARRAEPETVDPKAWAAFAARLDYVAADATAPDGARALKASIDG